MTKTDEDNQDDQQFWGTSELPAAAVSSSYIVHLDGYEGETQIGDNEDDLPFNDPTVVVQIKRNLLFRPLTITGFGVTLIGVTLLANFVIR